MLHAAGVPFEDVRVEKIEHVGDLNKLPFRQIPILEAKGHVIAQSNAINRYAESETEGPRAEGSREPAG